MLVREWGFDAEALPRVTTFCGSASPRSYQTLSSLSLETAAQDSMGEILSRSGMETVAVISGADFP